MQQQALNWLLTTGQWDALVEAGIDGRYFGDCRAEYEWVSQFVQQHGKVPDVITFLQTWTAWEYVPYRETAAVVVQGLKRTLFEREAFALLKGVAERLTEADPSELLGQLQSGIMALSHTMTGHVLPVRDVTRQVDWVLSAYSRYREAAGGIEIGIPDFPRWEAGEYVVLAARPGTGKTWLGLYFALQARRQGRRVLFLNLEMTELGTLFRLLTLTTHLPNQALREGRVDPEQVREALQRVQADPTPFHMVSLDGLDRAVSSALIESYIRQLQPEFVVIDQFSKIVDDQQGKDRWRFVNISNALQRMAVRYHVPVLLLVQLNREAAQQMRSSAGEASHLEHIAESDAPLQDADKVITARRVSPDLLKLYLGKNRIGKEGISVTLSVDFELGIIEPEAVEGEVSF